MRKLREKGSELYALWEETSELGDWLAEMDDLCMRLERMPLEKGEARTRKAARVRVFGTSSSEAKYFSLAGTLPDLNAPHPTLGTPTSIRLSLSQDISKAEWDAFVRWISSRPELKIGITEYPRKKSIRPDYDLLNSLSHVKHLLLDLERLPTLRSLASFSHLTNVQVDFCSARHPLASLTSLQNLSTLAFYEPKPEIFADDLRDLTQLGALESLEFCALREIGKSHGSPVAVKFKVAALPALPRRLKKIHITNAELADITLLRTGAELTSIDIAESNTDTRSLDISCLEKLSRFELCRVAGVSQVSLPGNLRSLQLEDVFGATARFSEDHGMLRALRLDAGAVPAAELSRLQLDNLVFAALRDAHTVQGIAHASQLSLLHYDCTKGEVPELASFAALRYLTLNMFRGDPDLLRQIATLPALEELQIFYDLRETVDLRLEEFDCLRRLQNLKLMCLIGVFSEQKAEEKLYDYLGVEKHRVIGSGESTLLGALEKELG